MCSIRCDNLLWQCLCRGWWHVCVKETTKSVMNFFTVQKCHKFEMHTCNLLRVLDFWLSGGFLFTLSLMIKEEPLREDFRSRALRKFSSLTDILRLLFFIFVYKWQWICLMCDGQLQIKGLILLVKILICPT